MRLPPLHILLNRVDPAVIYALDDREMVFYPCREGIYIPWTLSDDGVWLPWNQHPELEPFHPNIIFLDSTLEKTCLVPSRDPADAWKGMDAMEEAVVYYETFGAGVKAFCFHPEVWEVIPSEARVQFEPYEVRVVPPTPSRTIKFR